MEWQLAEIFILDGDSGLGKIQEPQGAVRRWQRLISSSSSPRDKGVSPSSSSSSRPSGYPNSSHPWPVSWGSVSVSWRCHQAELVAQKGKGAMATDGKTSKPQKRGREAQQMKAEESQPSVADAGPPTPFLLHPFSPDQ